MGNKPPATVGERISKGGRHDLGAPAPFSTKTSVIPAREIARFGHHTTTDRGLRSVLNPFRGTAIPVLCLNCFGRALRALVSLRVCGPVCLHDKISLPRVLLQACFTLILQSHLFCYLVQLIHLLIELALHTVPVTVRSIESIFKRSIYVRHHSLARPEFFFLGYRVIIAFRNSLALLPWHVRATSGPRYTNRTSVLMHPRQREG